MQIPINTTALPQGLGPTSTVADYMQEMAALWIRDYQRQYGGTRDEALAAALDRAKPDAKGRIGVRARIRADALRRKRDGGFLPTVPAGNTRWMPSDPATLGTLAAYASAAAALPAGLDIQMMDGTSYALSKTRIGQALDAYALQMAAIDAAEKAALTAQAADPATFNFDSIAWPATYTAA